MAEIHPKHVYLVTLFFASTLVLAYYLGDDPSQMLVWTAIAVGSGLLYAVNRREAGNDDDDAGGRDDDDAGGRDTETGSSE